MSGLVRLRPQLYVGRRQQWRPRASKMLPLAPHFGCKPKGGLWTSTYTGKYGSDWVQWCKGEQFGDPDTTPSWVLYPRASRVFVIDGMEALGHFCERFALMKNGYWCDSAWHLFANEYDALHVTQEGHFETRYDAPEPWGFTFSTNGYDCESTVWVRWRFRRVQALGIRSFVESRIDVPCAVRMEGCA